VFAREFWFVLLRKVGLQASSPQQDEPSFDEWWAKAESRMDDSHKKELNSLIILGAWTIWNDRNRCIFYSTPNLAGALLLASEEQRYWSLAKAQGSSSHEPVDSQYGSFCGGEVLFCLSKRLCFSKRLGVWLCCKGSCPSFLLNTKIRSSPACSRISKHNNILDKTALNLSQS
jgi:hypothetical protein